VIGLVASCAPVLVIFVGFQVILSLSPQRYFIDVSNVNALESMVGHEVSFVTVILAVRLLLFLYALSSAVAATTYVCPSVSASGGTKAYIQFAYSFDVCVNREVAVFVQAEPFQYCSHFLISSFTELTVLPLSLAVPERSMPFFKKLPDAVDMLRFGGVISPI
jgi:hypothetical protein